MALTHTLSGIYIPTVILQHFSSLSHCSLSLSCSLASMASSSSASSSAASHCCFFCQKEIAEVIMGWPLKNGGVAKLCMTCGSAYANGRFCDTFHIGKDGWRDCALCQKPLHCGCIMSCHLYAELDFGGVGCSKCLLQIERSIISAANDRRYLTDSSHPDIHFVVSNDTISESLSLRPLKGNTSAPHFEGNSNMDSSSSHTGSDNKVGSETLPLDACIESLHSQNLPQMTNDKIQIISENSNSDAKLLFEKTLTASDTYLNTARLVIPKKCAEAYFPNICETQGFPITVQDTTGRDWRFQYRCWQNSNSKKMYVLEGLKDYMVLNQWQIGDTVTFHQAGSDGKLVIGTKKTSVAPSASKEQSPMAGKQI